MSYRTLEYLPSVTEYNRELYRQQQEHSKILPEEFSRKKTSTIVETAHLLSLESLSSIFDVFSS